jgi:hypothetical protein
MSCSFCGELGDSIRANTGRDELLPLRARELRQLGLDSREDLRECPTCGAFFVWIDDSAQTGSGNNDEEILTRIPPERAATVHACVHRGDEPPDAVARRIGDALLGLPYVERGRVFAYLARSDRDLLHALLPRLVVELARTKDRFVRDVLRGAAYERREGVAIAELAERTPHADARAEFDWVLEIARTHA